MTINRVVSVFSIAVHIGLLLVYLVVTCYGNVLPYAAGRQISKRVINGQATGNGEHPWLVRLSEGNRHICGGTLINECYSLTAAHCLKLFNPNKVTLGDHSRANAEAGENIYTKGDPAEGQQTWKDKPHPDANAANSYMPDIALIKLDPCITETPKIKPICLASKQPKPECEVTVYGWGSKDATKPNEIEDKPLKRTEKIEECNAEGGMCITIEPMTAFHGDSGGPLIGKGKDGKDCQVGIVRGRKPGEADLFMDVSKYLDWIKKQIKDDPCPCDNPTEPKNCEIVKPDEDDTDGGSGDGSGDGSNDDNGSNKKCPRPEKPQNGKAKFKKLTPGSTVKYFCKKGFKLVGQAKQKCENGRWSGYTPVCNRIKRRVFCPDIVLSPNIFIKSGQLTNNRAGARVTFECNHGYKMAGRKVRPRITCSRRLKWSGRVPRCILSLQPGLTTKRFNRTTKPEDKTTKNTTRSNSYTTRVDETTTSYTAREDKTLSYPTMEDGTSSYTAMEDETSSYTTMEDGTPSYTAMEDETSSYTTREDETSSYTTGEGETTIRTTPPYMSFPAGPSLIK
ncbi:unnamed protein product [Owenia fusiformis]|uniref:Uncharacterized protein n=1 Tax=Owenia fusiformis TaxID=6347 RepID=A0A8S4PWC4_OWEFU|nr:unnamed protein product [Owenia fusiformis]